MPRVDNEGMPGLNSFDISLVCLLDDLWWRWQRGPAECHHVTGSSFDAISEAVKSLLDPLETLEGS